MTEETAPAHGPELKNDSRHRRNQEREGRYLSYEGVVVPKYLVILWLAFLAFGFIYFARYILL